MRWGIGERAAAFVLDAVTSPSSSTATFAGNGHVASNAGGAPSTTKAMAIDALGRIIVSGTYGKMVAARLCPEPPFGLARLPRTAQLAINDVI